MTSSIAFIRSASRIIRYATTSSLLARTGVRHSSGTSTMHDNDPEVLELEKQRNLTQKQHTSAPHQHAPGWNEALASASEANVKADKSTLSPADLPDATVEYLHKRYSPEERVSAREMLRSVKDEVQGPLSSAAGQNIVDLAGEDEGTQASVTRKTIRERQEETVESQTKTESQTVKTGTGSEESVKADRGDV